MLTQFPSGHSDLGSCHIPGAWLLESQGWNVLELREPWGSRKGRWHASNSICVARETFPSVPWSDIGCPLYTHVCMHTHTHTHTHTRKQNGFLVQPPLGTIGSQCFLSERLVLKGGHSLKQCLHFVGQGTSSGRLFHGANSLWNACLGIKKLKGMK